MKNLAAFIYLFTTSLLHAQAPSWAWASSGGGVQNDFAGGYINYASSSISTDQHGNSYVTGLFNGAATFGTVSVNSGTVPNVFIAKYDVNGTCLWVKHFGGDDADIYGNHGCGTSLDKAGNVYVTGTFHGSGSQVIPVGSVSLTGTGARQIFLVKLDPNGNFLWAKQPLSSSSTNNYATSVSADTSGNSCITGYLGGGTSTFGSSAISTPGGFTVKYDANGNVLWGKSIGGSTDAASIYLDQGGNVLVTGYAQGSGSFATTPTTSFATTGMRDIFVAKFNSLGNFLWIKHFGGTSSTTMGNPTAYGKGIGSDAAGNIYVTGDFSERVFVGADTLKAGSMFNTQAHFIKLDGNGQPLWARQTVQSNTTSPGTAEGRAITVLPDGRSFVTGMFHVPPTNALSTGTVTFPPSDSRNVFVLNLETSGNFKWGAFTSSDNSVCDPSGISLDAAQNIYISGNIQGITSFGGNTVTPVAKADLVVAKLGNAVITGLKDHLTKKIAPVYPNPFTNELYIDAREQATPISELIILDALGRLVLTTAIDTDERIVTLPSTFGSGIYFYHLKAGGKVVQAGKLVRE